jgi:hypothetical protein
VDDPLNQCINAAIISEGNICTAPKAMAAINTNTSSKVKTIKNILLFSRIGTWIK